MRIVAVNISPARGTPKTPAAAAFVARDGLRGDAHAGPWHRQLSLLAAEAVAEFARQTGRDYPPGAFGENLITAGLDTSRLAPLDRLVAGEAELEVTQLGKVCHDSGCTISAATGRCVMPERGVFLRVAAEGTIRPGDAVEHRPRPLRMLVVTVSDRVSAGLAEDRSGPRARALLAEFLRGRPWHPEFAAAVVPDRVTAIRRVLEAARADGVDFVVTTGGTGAGPRDITPDVVCGLADKLLPGIMEAVRQKHGPANPAALLSRGVAAVAGRTIIYTLPGGVRAVEEHLAEILRSAEHLLLMVHGIGH